jgi:tRNA wybutosine-synthesizing protein 4
LITKYQAEQLKYFTDPYIAPFVKQKRKMMPIINRGSWARVYSFRQVIIKFIKMFDKVNILSLGAGYDSTYFWLKSQNLATVVDYIEVDFPDLV